MKTWSQKPGRETLTSIPCDFCGGTAFRPLWDCCGFAFVRCQACRLIQQNPQPDRQGILDRYNDQYFDYEIENERQFFGLMLKGLADAGLTAPAEHGGTFMDIGCATGLLLEHQMKLGWQVQGVEVCAPAARYGMEHRGVPIHIGPLEEAGFSSASFDVIHFSHLIEHLNHPKAFLQEVFRLLKPSGRILVTTPNADGFQAWLFGSAWRSAIADHLYLFDRRTLRGYLEGAGFSLRKVVTWGGLAVGAGPRWLKALLDPAAKQWGFGDVMLMEAVKPVA